METKECKECKSQINKGAKKCPHCQSDQRDFLHKHPITSVLLILFAIGFLSSMFIGSVSGPSAPVVKAPVSEASMTALKEDLEEWGEGRWVDVQGGQSNGEVIVKVYALPGANSTAVNAYCKILKDSAAKYIPSGYALNLFVYQNGKVAKACL